METTIGERPPFLAAVQEKDPGQTEFHQSVAEWYENVAPVVEKNPVYAKHRIIERMVEPDRVISFRVLWEDDQGQWQVNRGYRVQMNGALGPYKGGLRFHPSVNLSVLKFLAFEQVGKNALTQLPLGAGKGGSDFDPKSRSEAEIRRFCQAFMTELSRHIGAEVDIPAGDIGVGTREIGFLYGQYKRMRNQFGGALTGKGPAWGGSLLRPEATGYGLVYFAAEMIGHLGEEISGKRCLVSGAGNVAQFAIEKLLQLGAVPLTVGDSSGYIYDEAGIDQDKLAFIKSLKNERRGRIDEYAEAYSSATFVPYDPALGYHPLWRHTADLALPCATQNEINGLDAQHMVEGGIKLVAEGANMPCNAEAVQCFRSEGIRFAPGKAANAGGVAVSGLEMAQNATRMSWSTEEVDRKLRQIMGGIHRLCLETAEGYGHPHHYALGADVASFQRVADAMIAQGI